MTQAKPTRALDPVAVDLTHAIGQLLRKLRSEAHPDDLNLSQSSVLARLEREGPATTADLARLESMKPQSMKTLLASLEIEACVERRPHPSDGRQILFAITARGLEQRRKRSAAKRAWLVEALAGIDPAELDALEAAIPILRRLGDAPAAFSFPHRSKTMSVTTLDPRTALVVIDLQKGIAGMPLAAPIGAVTGQAAKLATAFRQHGLPVVLVNVAGMAPGRNEFSGRAHQFPPEWAELLPELGQQPGDHLVTKFTWGAFAGTGLEALLKAQGVTQVVLCGVATSIGVESTAREAYALGLNVTLATDAMTDLSLEAHANSIERIFPRLGETGSSDAIIALLDRRGA